MPKYDYSMQEASGMLSTYHQLQMIGSCLTSSLSDPDY